MAVSPDTTDEVERERRYRRGQRDLARRILSALDTCAPGQERAVVTEVCTAVMGEGRDRHV